MYILQIYKVYKQGTQLYKVSFEEQTQAVLSVTTYISYNDLIYKIIHDNCTIKSLYHRAYIAKYLLQNLKSESKELFNSEHKTAFTNISTIKDDVPVHKEVFWLTTLLDQLTGLNLCPRIAAEKTT